MAGYINIINISILSPFYEEFYCSFSTVVEELPGIYNIAFYAYSEKQQELNKKKEREWIYFYGRYIYSENGKKKLNNNKNETIF